MNTVMVTRVPAQIAKRAKRLAKADGIPPSAWLRRLLMAATQDGEVGQEIRSKVAATLAGSQKRGG